MAPGNPALAGWVDRFQRDIVYRRPIFRRSGILRYVTRVAAFPIICTTIILHLQRRDAQSHQGPQRIAEIRDGERSEPKSGKQQKQWR